MDKISKKVTIKGVKVPDEVITTEDLNAKEEVEFKREYDKNGYRLLKPHVIKKVVSDYEPEQVNVVKKKD